MDESNFPRYNISGVFSCMDRLSEATSRFVGQRLTGDVYSAFVESVAAVFLASGIGDSKSLSESCVCLLGKILDEKEHNVFCWRMAGNTAELKRFCPVKPWNGQFHDEWMPAQIVDCVPSKAKTKLHSNSFTFRILAGSASSLLCRKVWSKKFCYFLHRRLGFTRPDKNYPFRDPSQFVGLRLLLLFKAGASSVFTGPSFDKVHVPSGLLGYNKIVLAKRARKYPGFQCPAGYSHACHHCFVGYDRCDMATHPRTYELRQCSKCLSESWFDPSSTAGVCVNCQKIAAKVKE